MVTVLKIGRTLLLSILFIGPLHASDIRFKVDTSGKKVFYNIPTRITSSGQEVPIYYSDRVDEYSKLIEDVCIRHGVDDDIVKAVIQVESNYNPKAVSPKGARGLMQLMPATAIRYGVQNIDDPWDNINGGVLYLKDLFQLFNSDLRLVLAAYNAGEKAVQRYNNDVPNYVETQNYVRKVLALYNGEASYTPYIGGRIRTITYYKYVDEKGVTHYSLSPVSIAGLTKVSFSY
jgi:soluble lytic murein transglycosylase-like protein